MNRIPTEIKLLNLTGYPVKATIHASKLPKKGGYYENREQIEHFQIGDGQQARTQMMLHEMMGAFTVSAITTGTKIYKTRHIINNLRGTPDTKQIIFLLDPKGVEPVPFQLTSGNHRLNDLDGNITLLRDEGLYKKSHPNNAGLRGSIQAYLESRQMDGVAPETFIVPLHTSDLIEIGFKGADTSKDRAGFLPTQESHREYLACMAPLNPDPYCRNKYPPNTPHPSGLSGSTFNKPYYHNPSVSNNVSGGAHINIKSGHTQKHFARNGESLPVHTREDYLNKYDFSETERVRAMKEGKSMFEPKITQGFSGNGDDVNKKGIAKYWYYAKNKTTNMSNWCWGLVLVGFILLVVLAVGFVMLVLKKKNGNSEVIPPAYA
jgi:hypothetical protein